MAAATIRRLRLGALAVLFFRPEIVHFVTVTYPSLFH